MKTIEAVICDLLRHRLAISGLINAISSAISAHNNARKYFYKFTYPQYGSKVYDAIKLIELNNMNINECVCIDDMAAIILRNRENINRLYEAVDKAREINCNGRIFYFTFINPFTCFGGAHSITLKGSQLIELDERN